MKNEDYVPTGITYTDTGDVPKDYDLYYRCKKCGGILRSVPINSGSCACGNIIIDKDYWILSVEDFSNFEVVQDQRPAKPPPKRDYGERIPSGKRMKYYYEDLVAGRGISSSEPVEADVQEICDVWYSLSRTGRPFLGIQSSTGVYVEFIIDKPESILITVPYLQKDEIFYNYSTFDECSRILERICCGDDPKNIPGLEFVKW